MIQEVAHLCSHVAKTGRGTEQNGIVVGEFGGFRDGRRLIEYAGESLSEADVDDALREIRLGERDETELLIIVTPYIVHAVDPHEIVKPDSNYSDASDPQTWLLGRVNRLYSSTGNSQPIQNYSGKVGFIND